jgi:hypothetical protein
MKTIKIRFTTVSTDDKWWSSQTKEFQKKYIKDHPKSKYAKNAKKSIDNVKKVLTGPDAPKKVTEIPKSVSGIDIKFKSSSDKKRAIEQITKDIKDVENKLNRARTPLSKKQASDDLRDLNRDLMRMKAGFDPFAEADEKYNQDLSKRKAEKEAEKKLRKETKELVNKTKVKPSVPGTKEYSDTATRLKNAAMDGDKIKINGKTVWAGLGNRSGLHSYAEELIREKWDKSGVRFMKSLDDLLRPNTLVEVFMFRNVTRDRGNWVRQWGITLRDKSK